MHNYAITIMKLHVNCITVYRLKEKFEFILRATFQHARNLAMLTVIYKTSMLIMQRISGRTHPLQNFIAAFMGGYAVFGENNKVNMQVHMLFKVVLPFFFRVGMSIRIIFSCLWLDFGVPFVSIYHLWGVSIII